MNLGVKGRDVGENWGTTKGNVALFQGTATDSTQQLDKVSTLILDEYRRMMIIRKARELNLLTVFLTVLMSVGVLVLAYLLQPVIHPKQGQTSCPMDPYNALPCGGYTTCTGTLFINYNETSVCVSECFCDCPIDRDGLACEHFAYGKFY